MSPDGACVMSHQPVSTLLFTPSPHLQSALIVDVLRAHQLILEDADLNGKVDDIIFMGHSLGGACSIIAAAKVQVSERHRLLLGEQGCA